MPAIETAARLEEIKFPEFTSKLINDTFDALIGANINQMKAYNELLEQTSKSLTDYINDTKGEITMSEITDFLAAIPIPNQPTKSGLDLIPQNSSNEDTDNITTDDQTVVDEVKSALTYKVGTTPDISTIGKLFDAVAETISSNKYTLLTTMVKTGLLRLVVTEGTIETRLTFNTYESEYKSKVDTETKNRGFGVNLGGNYQNGLNAAKGIGKLFSIAGGGNYSNVKVNTSVSTSTSSSGTNISIMGRVEIKFKTDYQPLNA